jgi:replication factor C large subunit
MRLSHHLRSTAVDWTERFRPATLQGVVGNGAAIGRMRKWADEWTKGVPQKRALILAGNPGVGKTTAAIALGNDMGWPVIELNASDARNAEKIKRVATAGAMHQTFTADGEFRKVDEEGGRKLIVLDEADNLYERAGKDSGGKGSEMSDRGGKTQIIATIRETQQPIILIVNDLYALTKGSGAALNSLCETLKFTRVNVRSIPKMLRSIAEHQGIEVDDVVFTALAEKAGGDLRAAVRDLESLCMGRTHVTIQNLSEMGARDTTGNMFDAVRHIMKGKPIDELRREMRTVDATPADTVMWVDENLPKEFVHPEDLVAGYDMLSRADRFLGRTQRTQNYRLWAYAGDLASIGVSVQKQHPGPTKFTPFGFPQFLSKMSRSRGARQTKDALAASLATYTHSSKRKARNEQVGPVEALFQANEEFAAHMAHLMELDDDSIAILLDEKVAGKRIKDLRARIKEIEEQQRMDSASAPKAPSTGGGLDAFEEIPEPAVGPEPETGKASAPVEESPKKPLTQPEGGQSKLF